MLQILLFPFKIVFGAIGFVFQVIGGVLSAVLSLVGGLVSLAVWGGVIALLIGLIAACIHRHHAARGDNPGQKEYFVSYYDKDAVK